MIWEAAQTLFMVGTLVTVMVNVSSVIRLTQRLRDVEMRMAVERREDIILRNRLERLAADLRLLKK